MAHTCERLLSALLPRYSISISRYAMLYYVIILRATLMLAMRALRYVIADEERA